MQTRKSPRNSSVKSPSGLPTKLLLKPPTKAPSKSNSKSPSKSPNKSPTKSPIKSPTKTFKKQDSRDPERNKQNLAAINGILSDKLTNVSSLYKKQNKIDCIFEIIEIYMRLLMGKQLSEKQSYTLHRYNKDGINFKLFLEQESDKNPPNLLIETSNDFYLCETDLYLGDMVITFPNPDHKVDHKVDEQISFQDAYQDFQASIGMQYDSQGKQDILDCTIMKIAFANCFLHLTEYVKDQEIVIQINKDQINQKDEQKKKIQKVDKNDDLYQLYEQFDILIQSQLKQQHKKQNNIINSTRDKGVSDVDIETNNNLYNRSRQSRYQIHIKQRKRQGFRIDPTPPEVPHPSNWIKCFVEDQKSYFLNQERYNKSQAQNSFQDMSQDHPDEYIVNIQNKTSQKKNRQSGQFLSQVESPGINIKEVSDQNQIRWKRTEFDTNDFLTLMRNSILIRLSQMGFFIRNFVSSNGSRIFSVLYYSEDNLKTQAEKQKMQKFLNIEFTDLFSLEPCDSSFRPLRQNNRLYRPKECDQKQLTEYFLYLRPKIINLIQEIQFKKIAREVNIQNLNGQLFSQGTEDIFQNEEFISDDTWTAFYEYLTYVKIKVMESRSKFKFDNDDALLINEQIGAKDLYILRNKKDFNLLQKDSNQKLDIKGESESYFEDLITAAIPKKQRYKKNQLSKQKRGDNVNLNSEQKIVIKTQLTRVQQIQSEYKTLRAILHLKPEKYIGTKHLKVDQINFILQERLRELLAFEYGSIFKEGIIIANQNRPGCLKNMWDFQQIELFEPSSEYFVPNNNLSYKRRCKINTIWKKYQVTESERISLFSNMERLKLVYDAILSTVNINYLMSTQYVEQIYALNDQYELFGRSQKRLFKNIFEVDEFDKFLQQTQAIHFSLNLKIVQKKNEIIGTQNTPSVNILSPKQTPRITLQANSYQQTETVFVQQKLRDLDYIWRFQASQPWIVPSEAIRNYYGEKIALYYTYLGHYTKYLVYIGLFGLIAGLLQYIIESKEIEYFIGISFGFVNVQWINLMITEWHRNEKHFAAKFGQSTAKKVVEQGSVFRPSFIGSFQRSVVNDNLNAQYYPFYKTLIKMLFNVIVLCLIFAIYQISIVGLFYLAVYLDKDQKISRIYIIKLEVVIPAVINVILILFFDEFYDKLSESLTNYENHQTVEDFESNFILKKFFLSLLSYVGPLFQIAYLSDVIGLSCADKDCYEHSRYYFATIFVCLFSLNIWEIIKPQLYHFIQHRQFIQDEEEDTVFDLQSIKSNRSMDKSRFDIFSQSGELMQINPFKRINQYIESESLKTSYVISSDRYGTVDDYMEISIQLALLGLYGTFFPLSYMIALVWNILEMQTDKKRLIRYTQRPVPIDESSIGIWYELLEFVANVCIIQNSAVILLLGQKMSDPSFQGVGFFLLVLFINFFGKFFQLSLIDEIPQRLKTLITRQNYLVRSTLESFKNKKRKDQNNKNSDDRDLIFYPLYKVYGCILEDKKQSQEIFNGNDSFENLSDVDEEGISEPAKVIKDKHSSKKTDYEYESKDSKLNQTKMIIAQFEFKFLKPKDVDKNILKLREFYTKTKIHYNELIDFQNLVEKNCSYQNKWTDQRILSRSLYMRRSRVLLSNLDYRRIKIYKERSSLIANQLYEEDWMIQGRKYLGQLDTQEDREKNQLIEEINQKSEIRSKRKVRRVIVLRINGIWFHQFRRSTKSQRALTTMEQQKQALKKNIHDQRKRLSKNRYVIEQGAIGQELLSTQSLIKNRKKVFDFVQTLDILRIPIFEILSTLSGNQEYGHMDICQEKHSYVKMIEQFSSLQDKKIEDAQRMKSNCDFPKILKQPFNNFDVQNFFLTNDQTNSLRSKGSNSIKLIRMIDNHSQNTKYERISKIFTTFRRQSQIWLIEIDEELDSLEIKKTSQYQLMEFLDVDQSCYFSNKIIQKSYGILRTIQNSDINDLLILKSSLYLVDEFYIQQPQFLDQYFDPFSKGYVATVYSSGEMNDAFGMSLTDILLIRKNLKMYYEENELIVFLHWLMRILQQLNISFNSHHGSIHPSNFILGSSKQKYRYKLLNLQGLFVEVQQNPIQRLYFSRQLQTHNREFMYASPELIKKYLQSQQVPEQYDDTSVDLSKNDVYSCGMLLLQMMTLGNATEQIMQMIEEEVVSCSRNQIGNLFQENVSDYIIKNENALMNRYPVVFTMIKDMLLSQSVRKNTNYIFNLITSEFNQMEKIGKGDDVFQENEILSNHINAQIHKKKNNLIQNSQQSLDTFKNYSVQLAQINQTDVNRSHLILAKQLNKLSLLYKLRLFDSLENELGLTMKLLQIIFNCDSPIIESIFQRVLQDSEIYFQFAGHQQLLMDILNIHRYQVLSQISARSTFSDIQKKNFVPNITQLSSFLTQFMQKMEFSVKSLLTEKQNLHDKFSLSLNQIQKDCKQQTQIQVDLIKAFCQYLAQQYKLALPFLALNGLSQKVSIDNQMLYIQTQMIFQLWIYVSFNQSQAQDKCILLSKSNLLEILQTLDHSHKIVDKCMVRKLQSIVIECNYLHVQMLIKQFKINLAQALWHKQMNLIQEDSRIKYRLNLLKLLVYTEIYWNLDDQVNFELCWREVTNIFSLWIKSINHVNSGSQHALNNQINHINLDHSSKATNQIINYPNFFIYQLIQLHTISESYVMNLIENCHKLEFCKQFQENDGLNYLVLTSLVKSYQIVNVYKGEIHLRNQAQNHEALQNKTSVNIFLYYLNLLTQKLLVDSNLDDKQMSGFTGIFLQETFINFLFANPTCQKRNQSQLIKYLSIPLNNDKIDYNVSLNLISGEMDRKYIFGKLMFKLNRTEMAREYFYNVFSDIKKLKHHLEKQKAFETLNESQLIKKSIIMLYWSFKCCMNLKEIDVAQNLLNKAQDILDYSMPWWQDLFKAIAIDFSLNYMNPTAQLVCKLAIKILQEINLFKVQDYNQKTITQEKNFDQINKFSILNTRFLLEEYTNQNNRNILVSFQKKQFIVSSLNYNLQELIRLVKIKLEDEQFELQQGIIRNPKNDQIQVQQFQLKKNLSKFEHLITVQSLLLEEGGDPVGALRFMDEDFTNMQLNEVIKQSNVKDVAMNYKSTLIKFKISGYQLSLNSFDKCISQIEKIDQQCKTAVQTLIDEVKQQTDGEQFKDTDKTFGYVTLMWRPETLFYINQGQNKQLLHFTQFKLLYYATRLKLLEALCMKGSLKQALPLYTEIMLYYCSFRKQYTLLNIEEQNLQQTINNHFIKGLFEYHIGIYYFHIELFESAFQYFTSAHRNYSQFNRQNYPKSDKEIKKNIADSIDIQDKHFVEEILRGQLSDDYIINKDTDRVLYEMQDQFSDPILELEILQNMFHFISCQVYCQIYQGRASLAMSQKNSSNLITSYDVIVETLEYTKKIMGRNSILYADALLVYTQYLMFFKYSYQEELLKMIFKSKYFKKNLSVKKKAPFRPGLEFQEYRYDSLVEDKFIFNSQDEIDSKLNTDLLGHWIKQLSNELIYFYTSHYLQVQVNDHLNLVECHLIQNKLYFLEKKLHFSEVSIELAEKMMLTLIPNQDHPLFIHLYQTWGIMHENTKEIIDENINITLKLKDFSAENKLFIIKELLSQNKELNQNFDEYKANPFDFYLVQKLQKIIQSKTNQSIKNQMYVALTKKQMQEILDIARDQVLKDAVKHAKSETKVDILKQQSIHFYRKAFMICKRIYSDRNPLYNLVEEKYMYLTLEDDNKIV